MALPTLLGAAVFYWRARKATAAQATSVPLKNPFSLTVAIKFALFFAAVLLVVKGAQKYFPQQGIYAVAGLAGLADVDAITLSVAGQAKRAIEPALAVNAIVIAILANTLVKCGFVVALGVGPLKKRLLAVSGIIGAAGIAVLLFW